MVNMCCVKGCNNESYPGSRWSFHRFPNDKIMKEKWLEVIPGKYTKTSVICSAHFKVEDFTPFSNLYSRKRLRPEAVPSIFMLGAQNRIPLVTKFKEESSESDEDRDDCEEPPSPTTPRSNETVEICVPIENKVIKPSDEDHRIFGEYVASELRNLSHHNAKRLKMMIRKSILEVTEDEYSETSIKCELN